MLFRSFLAARLSGSFDNLNCKNYGLTDPVNLTLDGNGVAVAATYNTAAQTAGTTGGGHHGHQGGHGNRHNWRANFMPGRHGHV